MVTIYLIRHAQSTGNIEKRLTGREEYALTLDGKKQVEKLTNKLKNIHFNKVYSSPSKRAVDTIAKLAQINNLKIHLEKDLAEMYFGIYDGFRWEEVNKINPNIHEKHIVTNEIMDIPEQETTSEVADRMYKKITEISKENEGKSILMASHGVAIEAFLREITKEPFVEKRKEYSQKNTSINIIKYDIKKNEFKIEELNNIEHLKYKTFKRRLNTIEILLKSSKN